MYLSFCNLKTIITQHGNVTIFKTPLWRGCERCNYL